MDTESEIEKPKCFSKPPDVSESEIYRFLYSNYLHQDRLSWSRTQALGVVEGGILAAAFAKRGLTATVTLLLGTILVWLIWRLIQRDWQNRDQHLADLDFVHKPWGIRMKTKPNCDWESGSFMMKGIIHSLIAINILAAIRFAWPSLTILVRSFYGN